MKKGLSDLSTMSDFNEICSNEICRRDKFAEIETWLQEAADKKEKNIVLHLAAFHGHLTVVDRLLRDKSFNHLADKIVAMRNAAAGGQLAVVDRLIQDGVEHEKCYLTMAAVRGHLAVVDRLLEDNRYEVAHAIRVLRPRNRKRFEYRERLTEICIAMQDMKLPAWVTVHIFDAARRCSTLPLHSKWKLVCTIKHFHDEPRK